LARTSERRTSRWVAFVAGAVAMLALALMWFAWISRDEAGKAAQLAAEAASGMPEVARPRLPDAPRIPDAPVPTPR
jgi:hypothetical protein